jgi:hypothetical protein
MTESTESIAETKIPDSLQELAVPIGALRTHPKNPRRGDVSEIAASLERYGQVRPVVALRDGTLIAGNHTFLAAQSLGWTHLAVVEFTGTDDEALQYLLADNRLSDKGEYDSEVLAGLLQQMMEAGQLEGTGYTPDDVDDILGSIDAFVETEPELFTGGYSDAIASTRDEGSHVPMKQYSLMYEPETAEEFTTNVKALMKKWGLDQVRDVVRAAVEFCAREASLEAGSAEVQDA